jgi:hypothetical protein
MGGRESHHIRGTTVLGTGAGDVLASGNCGATYYGDKLGYWDDRCSSAIPA